ncbi:hypothetical protein Lepto7376_4003 [[Leptolyngbya] sp. PCC 7376]|uniref:sulfotransferase-like domain-containing protein n=1 Tax=[Leptolyngbya] sp. PCC 7376 TaxID=111781 RepID=UPI00029F2B45|nr:hypothetical protein [[Leptolyngbya] sp. PCC 7376]AFY40142.1 hypothetical protein Lepto7376_4003 [[Leptolyngbya] sp. PCC 7376]
MEPEVKRIAMWASPRCLSTVLLRSWSSRPDTFVQDEPLYPHYLFISDRQDPEQAEILAQYETDWRKIITQVTTRTSPNKSIYYYKFMVYRLLPHIETHWVHQLTNCFLIRDPREMILSYLKLWGTTPTLESLGTLRLKKLFNQVCEFNSQIPPVVDAKDLLENPKRTLSLLCAALEIDFDKAMLSWPNGNPTNDVWSKYHWYDTVRNSTTFHPDKPKTEVIPPELHDLLKQCNQVYQELYQHRLV